QTGQVAELRREFVAVCPGVQGNVEQRDVRAKNAGNFYSSSAIIGDAGLVAPHFHEPRLACRRIDAVIHHEHAKHLGLLISLHDIPPLLVMALRREGASIMRFADQRWKSGNPYFFHQGFPVRIKASPIHSSLLSFENLCAEATQHLDVREAPQERGNTGSQTELPKATGSPSSRPTTPW